MFEELFWRILEVFVGMNLMKSSHCCCCCKLFKTTTTAQHPQHFNSQCTLCITYNKIHIKVQHINIMPCILIIRLSYQDMEHEASSVLSNTPLQRELAKCLQKLLQVWNGMFASVSCSSATLPPGHQSRGGSIGS